MSNSATALGDEAAQLKARQMALAVKIMAISLVAVMVLSLVLSSLFTGMTVLFGVVPVVVALWLAVIRLTWLAYSPLMGMVAIIAIAVPIVLVVVALLSWQRAKLFIASQGFELSFWGDLNPLSR